MESANNGRLSSLKEEILMLKKPFKKIDSRDYQRLRQEDENYEKVVVETYGLQNEVVSNAAMFRSLRMTLEDADSVFVDTNIFRDYDSDTSYINRLYNGKTFFDIDESLLENMVRTQEFYIDFLRNDKLFFIKEQIPEFEERQKSHRKLFEYYRRLKSAGKARENEKKVKNDLNHKTLRVLYLALKCEVCLRFCDYRCKSTEL